MAIRPVKRLIKAKPTLEGSSTFASRVRVRRYIGFYPFLLLDDFCNDRPENYIAGFPWRRHRAIETITYVLAGTVEHGDSLGHRGVISAGDVQWMAADRSLDSRNSEIVLKLESSPPLAIAV